MMKLMIPAVLFAALIPNAAPAQEDGQVAIHVAFRDLDLSSPAGVKQLDRRLDKAIAAVCPYPIDTDISRKLEIVRCRTAKWAEVAAQRANVLRYGAHRDTELAAARPAR